MGATRDSDGNDFARHEIKSIYVSRHDRFVVSLVVGYNTHDVRAPEQAAAAALALVLDGPLGGTQWAVYDRETGKTTIVEQGDEAMLSVWDEHIKRVQANLLKKRKP